MTAAIGVKVRGVAEVRGKLDGLKQALKNRIVRRAVMDATKPLLRAMKALAPRDTDQLRRSLGRKVKVYRDSNVVVGIVGPRSGFKQRLMAGGQGVGKRKRGGYMAWRNPTRYAHLAERKTSFASNAAAQAQAQAEEALRLRLEQEIAKAAGSAA